MTITPAPETEALLRQWIESRRYATVDEALAAAVRSSIDTSVHSVCKPI